mgnify:CR=1 FL=1
MLVAVDARMGEVYWGAYQRNATGLMELVGEECVSPPMDVPLPEGGEWRGAGAGWAAYENVLSERCENQLVTGADAWDGAALPHARDVAVLGLAGFDAGLAVSAEQALPVYLRDKVTWKKVR